MHSGSQAALSGFCRGSRRRISLGITAMIDIRREPSLDELLDDPIFHVLLAGDGLKIEDVRRFFGEMKRRLRRRGEE